jgi:TonB family protein
VADTFIARRWQHAARLLLALTVALADTGHAQNAPAAGEVANRPRLTKPPQLKHFVEARYPASEKSAGRAASVVLQIAVNAQGAVDDVRVLESAGAAFDEAAVAAARAFVFDPAEIDDKPSPIRINYKYDFVLEEEAPTTGSLVGVVRKRGSNEPLAGVTVELDTGERAVTGDAGQFHFETLAPGKHRITLSRDDIKAMQTEEQVEAGSKLDAVYEVDLQAPAATGEEESDDMEIVIVAPTLTKQVVSTKVEADHAKRVAGTQGDVLKIVENMPGVARATAGSGQVVVWGASPQDTRVYVDGVRIPLLYHFGGLRSVIHTDLVRSVELVPGGYGAAYGRGLGGLITVETRAPRAKAWHGSVALDLLDASATANGPITDRLSVAIAARRSHLDWALDQATDEDVEEFFPIGDYHDGQARIRYALTPTSFVDVGGLLSSDAVSRTVSSADPADRKSESRDLDFGRVHARYEWNGKDGSQVSILPWVGRDESRLVARFGGTPSELVLDSTLYGLRSSWRGRAASFLTATVGLDLEAVSTSARRAGSIVSPPREGDLRVFGQPPSDQVNTDDWKVVSGSAAPFAEADFAVFGDKLHIVPGLRLEPSVVSVNRRIPVEGNAASVGAYVEKTQVQPRLSIRYQMSDRVSFKAAYGVYGQAAQPEELSSVFGNPLLENASATHWLAGGAFQLTKTLALETTVFHSRSQGLVVRNPISAPRVAEALIDNGEGRAFGSQFLLRQDLTGGFFGWIAYTLLRSERLDRPHGNWRLFDFDQTHVLTALAAYDLGAGFDVGARVRYASGYPRTPVVGAFYDARRDAYSPILGAHNATRVPDFVQLDLRAAKRFDIAKTKMEVYLDVQNVTDRENAEEIVYSSNYGQRRYIRGLPILPVFGAKWDW